MKTRHAKLIRFAILEGRKAWMQRKRGAFEEYRYHLKRLWLADEAWLRGYIWAFKKHPPIPPKGPSGISSPKPQTIVLKVEP